MPKALAVPPGYAELAKKVERGEFPALSRTYKVRKIDEEARTVELSFSSEEEVERWFGMEKLDHKPSSVRLERIRAGGPLLWQHIPRELIGVVDEVEISADRVGRAVVRFGKSAQAVEIFQDVVDEVITNVSVGYAVHGMRLESDEDGKLPVYLVDDWEILEISLVSIPADTSVGIGRAADFAGEAISTRLYRTTPDPGKERNMPPTPPADPPADPPAAPVIVLTDERNKWAEETRKEHEDMLALGEAQKERVPNAVGLAAEYMAKGKGIEELKSRYLEDSTTSQPVDPNAALLGMDERELKRWSFRKVINALRSPHDRAAQDAAAFERECSNAFGEKIGKEFRGFGMPLDVMCFTGRFSQEALIRMSEVLGRDLVVGTPSAGGNLKGTDLLGASFIDVLRASNPIIGDSTPLTGLVGDIAIPRHSAATQAYWVAESGSPTEGAPTFDQVTGAPKTVGGYLDLSRKLQKQSAIDIEEFALMDLAVVLGLAIAQAIVSGSGTSNEPTGILNTSGIGDVAGGTNGLAPTWVNISNIKREVAKDNALRGVPRWYLNSDTVAKLEQTVRFASTDYPILDADRGGLTMAGYGFRETNLVPNDLDKGTSTGVCSAILMANMADCLLGMWGGLDINIDTASLSTSGGLRIVALQDVDVMIRHAESFSAMQDALTV